MDSFSLDLITTKHTFEDRVRSFYQFGRCASWAQSLFESAFGSLGIFEFDNLWGNPNILCVHVCLCIYTSIKQWLVLYRRFPLNSLRSNAKQAKLTGRRCARDI